MGKHIAGQLVRSGASTALSDEEACAAESRRDFIHKVRIDLKELRETRCWIKLIMRSDLLPETRMAELAGETDELCRLFGQSLVTARKNEGREKAKGRKPTPK